MAAGPQDLHGVSLLGLVWGPRGSDTWVSFFLFSVQYDNLLSQFGCMQVSSSSSSHSLSTADAGLPHTAGSNIEQYIHDLDTNSFELDLEFSEDEKRLLLEKQASGNPW